ARIRQTSHCNSSEVSSSLSRSGNTAELHSLGEITVSGGLSLSATQSCSSCNQRCRTVRVATQDSASERLSVQLHRITASVEDTCINAHRVIPLELIFPATKLVIVYFFRLGCRSLATLPVKLITESLHHAPSLLFYLTRVEVRLLTGHAT